MGPIRPVGNRGVPEQLVPQRKLWAKDMPCPSKLHRNEATSHLCSELRAWSTPWTGPGADVRDGPTSSPKSSGQSSSRHRGCGPLPQVALCRTLQASVVLCPGQSPPCGVPEPPSSSCPHRAGYQTYLPAACPPPHPLRGFLVRVDRVSIPESPQCALCALPASP